jgi:predicted lactoylglutathione lyase
LSLYPGISMVTLGVADVEKSGRFYQRLGWRCSMAASNESICFLALNNIVLALFGRAALAHDCGLDADVRRDMASFPGFALAQNYGSEAAVDRAFDHAIAAGGRKLVEPQRAAWGGYHGIFADPDGHIWELAFNPIMELAADGTLNLPL